MRTTYGDISPRTAGYATKRLLIRGQHLMTVERFGQYDPQGQKKTLTRKFRRYNSLPRATMPLAEGITPQGQRLTHTDVEARLEQYGDLVEITDVIADTHEDPVLMETMDICGEQAAETVEVIRIDALKGGSNVVYAGGVSVRTDVAAPITVNEFRLVERGFRKNKGRPISQIIAPSHKVATEPVAPAFFAMGHTDLKADIYDIPGFVPVEKYADHMKALPGEVGAVENTRIILTALFEPWLQAGASSSDYLTNGATGTGAADVYPLLVVARDAYGIVPLQGKNSIKPSVINPDQPTKSDPLGQRGFVSWKTYQTALILNQSWIARIEVAASKL